jgi:hypothetical protein
VNVYYREENGNPNAALHKKSAKRRSSS